MAQRLRGQEATVQIVIGGDVKGGSFARVTDFNLTPRTELNETPFLGEVEDDIDILHSGYDFDFSLMEEDSTVRDVLFDIVEAEQNRAAHPAVNVVVTFSYRGGGTSTIVLENCFIKLDSLTIGGRKDYITNKFSGKCKTIADL